MASGRRSVHGSGSSVPPKQEPISVPRAKEQRGGDTAALPAAPAQHSRQVPDTGRVRVWWEPTDDKNRSGFGGAWWPAQVVATNEKKNRTRVRYDNGEEDEVHNDHVSPLTLPVEFGQEATQLRPGEFCEVHNGSKTDPGAWIGRVVRLEQDVYKVEYPFHDSKPEKIKPQRIRRARIMEDGEWRLIKPEQTWADGEVTSPKELELIPEDDLEDYFQWGAVCVLNELGSSPTEGGAALKRSNSKGSEPANNGRSSKVPRTEPPPRPSTAAAEGSRAHGVASPSAPPGMTCMYMTMEPRTTLGGGGGLCFVPLEPGSSMPSHAVQAFLPLADVLRYQAERKQVLQQRAVDLNDTEDVLTRGLDLKGLKVHLAETGYSKRAFQLLQEAWRADAPNVGDALRSYKTHVHNRTHVDWDAFLGGLLGPDRAKALKKGVLTAAAAAKR